MADNYLENRYEEIFGKGSSAAKSSASRPGLESLLKLSSEGRTPEADYKVHPLQAEALLRTLSLAFPDNGCTYEVSPGGRISLNIHADSPFQAGRMYEAIALKAAEMGLFSRILSLKDKDVVLEINK